MGILLRKHQGEIAFTKIAKLSIIGFLAAFASSLAVTVWAIYIDSFLHNVSLVGIISASLTFLSIISYFVFIPFVERTSKSKIFAISLVAFTIGYVLLSFVNSLAMFLAIAGVIVIFGTFRITSYGLMVKDQSKKSTLTKNEGLRFTFTNIAFIIGPLVAGFVANRFGVSKVFLLASVFFLMGLLILKIGKIEDNRVQKKQDKDMFKNFFAFFKDKKRIVSYTLSGGISFWWVLIYLFVPLEIIRSGLSPLWVGYFLFAIPIPLILLEYKFSKLANRHGFKRLFRIGFLIPAIIAIMCFFFAENIFVVMGLLIVASLGLAMLEPTLEAYFFKVTNKKDEQRFYGPFNTCYEVFGFLGKIIPSLVLLALPFKYVYIIFGIIMLGFFLVTNKVKI